MNIVTEKEINSLINNLEPFSAYLEGGGMHIHVDKYIPVIGTAVHSGARLRKELVQKIALTRDERFFEEDPMTDRLIGSCPIVLTGNDSRYQYDLNRTPEACIYDKAWGKTVWKQPLSKKERQLSLESHASYYRVLESFVTALEKRFSRVILYDLHSYNFKRKGEDSPLFNIGTYFIDYSVFGEVMDDLQSRLAALTFPKIKNRVGIDDVFQGQGYQAAYMHQFHPDSLCIPLEIKKVYMNEMTGELFPEVIEEITAALASVLGSNSQFFIDRLCQT